MLFVCFLGKGPCSIATVTEFPTTKDLIFRDHANKLTPAKLGSASVHTNGFRGDRSAELGGIDRKASCSRTLVS